MMTPDLLEQILLHAKTDFPREACGVLVWDGKFDAVYRPCRNLSAGNEHFQIAPEDWVAAEDAGIVLGVVHSHPGEPFLPTDQDRKACDRSGVPWWVFAPDGTWARITPHSHSVVGHPFAWGVQDCYTLMRDALRIHADFVRSKDFWERENLFMNSMEAAGYELRDVHAEIGDGMLMSIRGQGVPNHCAVYVGSGRILHHLPGRLSREEDIGPLNRAITSVVRRKR